MLAVGLVGASAVSVSKFAGDIVVLLCGVFVVGSVIVVELVEVVRVAELLVESII